MNPRQEEAVLHTEGPLLVMAGAGKNAGSHRIAYQLRKKKSMEYFGDYVYQ